MVFCFWVDFMYIQVISSLSQSYKINGTNKMMSLKIDKD